MSRTFIGLFEHEQDSSAAIRALRQLGLPQESFKLYAQDGQDQGRLEMLADALRDLGLPESESHAYIDGVHRGGTLLVITADELTIQTAYDTLKTYGLVDVNQRATEARIVEREHGAAGEDSYFTPSETVGPSVVEKWRESNKVLTSTGTAAGAVQGAIIGTAVGGPVGTAIGAAAGAVIGATAGATADATIEAVKQEDAARHEAAADHAGGAPPAHDRPEGQLER